MKRILGTLFFASLLLMNGVMFGAHNVPTDPFSSAGPEAIPQLTEAAKSEDPADMELKIKAIQRLGQLKAKEAVPVIIEALGYGSETIIREAGGRRIYNWKVRVVSAKALADIGDDRAVKPLTRRVHQMDEDNTVRRASVQALGLMGETARKKETLVLLYDLLEKEKDNALVADVCEALGKIGDKSAFVPLLRITQGPYLNRVKEEAQKAISRLKWNEASVFDEENKDGTTKSGTYK